MFVPVPEAPGRPPLRGSRRFHGVEDGQTRGTAQHDKHPSDEPASARWAWWVGVETSHGGGRPPRKGVVASTTRSRLADLAASAAQQRNLVTRRQAEAAGIGDRTIRCRCDDGSWRRVVHGVYAVGPDPDGLQVEHAHLLAGGDAAFLHRRSAAVVHGGMDLPRPTGVDIARPPGRAGRLPRRVVPERHLVVRKGLRCTDGLQTLLDLAARLEDAEWEWALEAVLRRPRGGSPLTTLPEIEAAVAAPGRKHPPSVARVRRVLALRPAGTPPTDSLLETRFIQLARRVGAPPPARQVEIDTGHRMPTYLDLAWPALGVFVELDGQQHLGQPVYDSSRETAVVATTGWLCGRFTWTEVVHNPTPTGRRLLALLEQGRRRPVVR